jgi:hypothetical protein
MLHKVSNFSFCINTVVRNHKNRRNGRKLHSKSVTSQNHFQRQKIDGSKKEKNQKESK